MSNAPLRLEITLRPCPFCGAAAESYPSTVRGRGSINWVVDCSECDANIESEVTREAAEKAWNRRPSDIQPSPATEGVLPDGDAMRPYPEQKPDHAMQKCLIYGPSKTTGKYVFGVGVHPGDEWMEFGTERYAEMQVREFLPIEEITSSDIHAALPDGRGEQGQDAMDSLERVFLACGLRHPPEASYDFPAMADMIISTLPREWDAEAIQDAPDSGAKEYRFGIINHKGEFVGWHNQYVTKADAVELAAAQKEEGFGSVFFGPIPQPEDK